MSYNKNALKKLLKRCWIPLAILVIFAAVVSSLFRALTPWAEQYKGEVEQHLATLLGKPVSIQTMQTGWYWFKPVIKLKQVSILDGKQAIVQLDNLLVGIDLLSSLWHWHIQPGILFLDRVHLIFRQEQGHWRVNGLEGKQQFSMDAINYQHVLAFILAQQKIIIKHLSAEVYMQNNQVLPIRDFNLTISHRLGYYRIKGEAHLAQATPTSFLLLADLALDPYDLNNMAGHVVFSVKDWLPFQWQHFLPMSRFEFPAGKGDLQLWGDVALGQLKNVQAGFSFQNLTWLDKVTQQQQLVSSIKANLAWNPTKEGWQLTGDDIHLNLNNTQWPVNAFMLRYQRATDAYLLFIKNILLQSLLKTAIPWPTAYQSFATEKLQGQFYDTQLHLKQGEIDYILTGFNNLGWPSKPHYPGVEHLSGVLYWQANKGRMELNSANTVLEFNNQPRIKLEALTAALDWTLLARGFRLNFEHVELKHPNLLLKANGVIDDITSNSIGNVHLNAKFSADDAHHWLAYLPAQYLKPQLDSWLKQDIKRIAKAQGELYVEGPWADFPFDRQPGKFLIKSYLSGVDLIFARDWPATKDIAGYLYVTKRNLQADITQADLNGILVEKANLHIDDIGLDKETLLIHGKVLTTTDKAQTYVLASPIRQRLKSLNLLSMQGPVELDLQLEAPLYPENDKVLALGDLALKNNTVSVHHGFDDVQLKQLNGVLQFDHEGILSSDLRVEIMGYPVNLGIQSIHQAEPYTEIKIRGKTTMEVIRNKLKLPIFSLMHGSFWLEGLLMLTEDPSDLDRLYIHSSLQGVSVDLPAPLGKSVTKKVPLELTVDFNPQKTIRLRANYGERLQSDLHFVHAKSDFLLQKGAISVGEHDAPIVKPQQQGLHLKASLAAFDLDEWQLVWKKLSKATTDNAAWMDIVHQFDLTLHKARLWRGNYKDLIIQATKSRNDLWSVNLRQDKLTAELNYEPQSNTLTGVVDKLHLEKSAWFGQASNADSLHLTPKSMPNLDLHVVNLTVDDLYLGELMLKATRAEQAWLIEQCELRSPYYWLMAKGDWQKTGNTDVTTMQTELQISNLAKSLEALKISPAIKARKGTVRFQGKWPGAFYDFSLMKISGQMAINLKNGQITDLNAETEKKLGLGKLLSILSLQTIPRRLQLDFSDLASDGYSFDEFKGDFTLAKGVMDTQNSYINGPVAYASMKGQLDIVKHLYNIDLEVFPNITASLPVVATIAGGPIAGVATLVASKIINQGMQQISGYTYRVSGTWQQPIVEQVHIVQKPQGR